MLPEGKCRYIDGQIYPDGNFYVLDTEHIKHNGSELKSALNGIGADVSNKVDKVEGKGLSTEDYTTAEKNKLSGIEANANNYVHPTTSGNKHIPSGGSSGKILGWSADGTAAWVDPASGGGSVDTVYIGSTEYAPDANGKVTLPTYPTTLPASDVYSWAKASTKPSYTASEVGAIAATAKGANNGVAELDSSGKVPSSQLPSYVDDVLEYSAKASFPATGETGKIYVDTSTNLTYRWSGSAYTEISPSLALGETSSTAYRGDRGKTAYNHSQLTSGNPHNVTKSDVGLGNVGNFKAVSTASAQGLSDTEKSNARSNIGAGTSSFSGSYDDLSNKPTIPTKTSQLTNDSGYTTNTGTVTGVKVGSTSYSPSSGIVSLPAYPTTLPASDVSSWAKASTKPTYTASEVGLGNVGNFKAVSTVASQGLSSTEQSNARANIGAGTSSFSGSYNDLSNKPTIPTKTSQLTNDSGYTTNTGTVTGVKVGSTSYSPSSGIVSLPAYPTTLPASDVSSWAKASSKPSYTYSEVGAASSSHTHNYAGSSSAGGAATSANKLNTNAGSATQPVYFSNGVPAATTYSLGKSVPSNAVFTDTHRAIKVDGTQVLASNSTALNFIGTGHVHVAHDSSNPGNITFYEENWMTFVDMELSLGDLTWTPSSSSPGLYYSGNVSVYRTGIKPAFSFIFGATIMDFNALPNAFISVGLSGTSSIWLLSNTNAFQYYTKLKLRIFGLISYEDVLQ